jgi:hypothetical protein
MKRTIIKQCKKCLVLLYSDGRCPNGCNESKPNRRDRNEKVT